MRADELIHSVRDSVPDALERGAGISNQLRAELYVSGVLTAPDSGTATVFQPDGQQVATGAVTVTDSVATFSVSISDTALLGDQYRVEWALTVGAETYRHRTRAEVVRKRLVCPISVVDLFRLAPQLDADATDSVSRFSVSDYADFIAEAWIWTQVQVRSAGRRPDLISSADALRECTLMKAMAMVYGALMLAGADRFSELHTLHDQKAARAFRNARLEYAPDDALNERAQRPGRASSLWLMGI